MPLTDIKCKNTKPTDKPQKLGDSGGLYLQVMPNGAKYWRMKYRIHGREKLLALGVYPETTLSEARDKRDAARKMVAQGTDPSAQKKEKKHLAALNAENTFEPLAREWHSKNKAKWKEKHGQDILIRLEKDIFPEIGNLPVRDITAPRLLSAIRKMEERGAHELARRARGTCEQIFAYGIGTGKADRNIALDLRGTLEAFKRGHYAAFDADELPAFLSKLEKNEARLYPQTIRATKLLMLTFVRTSELINAAWDEFDFANKVWNIPAERMKKGRPHLVPLSRQAIELFNEQKEDTNIFQTPYVFPSQIEPRKPMSNGTILGGIKRMGYKGEMTGHGFRSLAMSTIKERLGYRHEIPDLQLAHSKGNKIDAAYDRAKFIEERTKMMQDWADYIDTLKKE
jgi:integrase